ncbi:MAG TPA: hypothetical protein VFS34_15520 [Thermoanaerobaculia bacterium]|nr:hypothetical protein [Thermoanaerobaculia bacterium]
MTLDLDAREAQLLREVCESALSDLRMEVAGTEDQDFRENLKRREQFLGSLLERLGRASL